MPSPLSLFETWLEDARRKGIHNAEAMTLASVDARGAPSARMVLYKGIVRGGLSFYTNYQSRKARELDAQPRAALVFHWDALERQIRIEGRVTRCTSKESDTYFATRDRGSQLGAWASAQSSVLKSRAELEKKLAQVTERFAGKPVPRPDFWGGYRLVPERVEFWQGKPSRLHERTLHCRSASRWITKILSP